MLVEINVIAISIRRKYRGLLAIPKTSLNSEVVQGRGSRILLMKPVSERDRDLSRSSKLLYPLIGTLCTRVPALNPHW